MNVLSVWGISADPVGLDPFSIGVICVGHKSLSCQQVLDARSLSGALVRFHRVDGGLQ
jgi:hypothetical protein